jgi:hypothetical protein
MLAIGVRFDPKELDDLRGRVQGSIRRLGSAELTRTLQEWGLEANRHDARAGLDRHGRSLVPWRVRRGRSDYHGRDYAVFSNRTTLIPFGPASRREDAFQVEIRRRSVGGVGFGAVTVNAGFSPRAGLIPQHWKRRGRDVLGMSPRARNGYQRLLTRHASAAHRTLKKGGAIGRAAAALL